jgi:hypothetical protein
VIRDIHQQRSDIETEINLRRFPDKTAVWKALVADVVKNGPYKLLPTTFHSAKPPAHEMVPVLEDWLRHGSNDQRQWAKQALAAYGR